MTKSIRTPAIPTIVALPVFPADDVVGRVQAASLAGELRVVLSGARLEPSDDATTTAQHAPAPETVPAPASDIPLGVLLEALRIKMYNENLSDLNIYGMLFEDRLAGTLYSMQDIQDFHLPDLLQVLKIKMFNESISDQAVYDQLFEDRLESPMQAAAPPDAAPVSFGARLRSRIRRIVGR